MTAIPSHIAEGFTRRSPREVCRFLDYALACLSEVEVWLASGVKRGHFKLDSCAAAHKLIRRTSKATLGFKRSQQESLSRTASGRANRRLSDAPPQENPAEAEKPLPENQDKSTRSCD